MKFFFQCCAILFVIAPTYGQVKIFGKVATGDGTPIPYVNIALLNVLDSALVKGGVSNDSGHYEFSDLKIGEYILKYSSIGYISDISPILTIKNPGAAVDLGIKFLKPQSQNLDTISIKSEKSLFVQGIDGMTINVQNSILTKGSSVLEVLSRSPGIYVDRESGSILLHGKSGVAVMINGKLMRLPLAQVVSMLNGMPADNLDKIELLTTPPAKYDAEGSAGLINIILRRNQDEGTKGTLTTSIGYGWGEKGSSSINITHNSRKFNIYGGYTYSRDRSYSDWAATGSEKPEVLGKTMDFDFGSATHVTKTTHDAIFGLETTLGKYTLGSSFSYNNIFQSYNMLATGEYIIHPDSYLSMRSNLDGTNRWVNTITSAYVERKIKSTESIVFGFDYLYYKNKNPSNVENIFLDQYGNIPNLNDTIFSPQIVGFAATPIKTSVIKIDYLTQLNKRIKIELGLKGTSTLSSSVSEIQSLLDGKLISLPDRSNNITMKEGIGAAYLSTTFKFNEETNLSVGLRYEYSSTNMDDLSKAKNIVNRKLGSIFPDLFLSKKITDNSSFNVSFTKRISRPSYNDLASFISYNDFVSVFTGNPSLRPTISHNLKFGFSFRDLSLSFLLGRDNNPIAYAQVALSPSKEWLYVSPQNLKYQNNLTIQTDIPIKLKTWWQSNNGFAGGWHQFKIEYTAQPARKTYFSYSVYSTHTFKLPLRLAMELSARYFSSYFSGSVRVEDVYIVNIGIKKILKKNYGTLQLSVDDLLRSQLIKSSFGSLTEEAFSLRSHLSYNPESKLTRIYRLTYSIPLGKSNVKDRNNKEIRYQDENSRVRKN